MNARSVQHKAKAGGGAADALPSPEAFMHAEVHRAIADRRLPPGTRLVEESLAGIFRVSRARVRRVLLGLSHDKVVTLEPNRGAFVSRPSAEAARHVFAARRVVEDAIVCAAAGSIAAADVERLRRLNRAQHDAHANRDTHGAIRLSGAFHAELAAFGGNPILAEFVGELISRSSLILALYERRGGPDCAFDEHERIVDAVAAGDGERAAAEMAAHLRGIEARLDLAAAERAPVSLRAVFAGLNAAPTKGRRAS